MGIKTNDIFLCHNSQDKPEVRQIYEAMKARGLKPWIDEVDMRPGDRHRPEIEAALQEVETAAVFVGKAGGRVQVREIDICIDLESRGKLRIIPVILPGCVDDLEIPGFLRNYSWVDFRHAGPDPLDMLCSVTEKADASSQPVVAVAPTTTSEDRSRLIVYCQNAGLLVPRAGIYPADTDSAARAFKADLENCHVVVQLCESVSGEASDEALKVITTVQSEYPHQNRVLRWKPGSITQAEFQKEVVDRARRVFDATRPDPGMGAESEGDEIALLEAMVKYDRVDAKPTRQMLRSLKEANISYTSSPDVGSTTLAERLREKSYAALVLVLGDCDNHWLEDRIDELTEVELTLKEQAPLQAYYYTEGSTAVPPMCSPQTKEFDGPEQLPELVEAIRNTDA